MSDDKPKTVVPPTRGRGGPHPAEVNEHLGLAYQLCDRLIEAAELGSSRRPRVRSCKSR